MRIFKHRKTIGEQTSPIVTQQTDTTSTPTQTPTSDTDKPIYRMTHNHLYKMDFNKNIGDKGAFVVRFSCRLRDYYYSKCCFELDNSDGIILDLPHEVVKEYKKEEEFQVDYGDLNLDFDGNNTSPERTAYVGKWEEYSDKFKFEFNNTGNCIFLNESSEVVVNVYRYPNSSDWKVVIKPWYATLVPGRYE